MMFTTITFLIFWRSCSLYWSLRALAGEDVLSPRAIFYGWWTGASAACSSSRAWWTSGPVTLERTGDERRRRRILTAALSTNLGILGLFKYFNFFTDSFARRRGLSAGTSTGHAARRAARRHQLPPSVDVILDRRLPPAAAGHEQPDRLHGVRLVLPAARAVRSKARRPCCRSSRSRGDSTMPGHRRVPADLWGFVKKLLIDRARGAGHLGAAGTVASISRSPACSSVPDLLRLSRRTPTSPSGSASCRASSSCALCLPVLAASLGSSGVAGTSPCPWFRDYVFIPLGGDHLPARRPGRS